MRGPDGEPQIDTDHRDHDGEPDDRAFPRDIGQPTTEDHPGDPKAGQSLFARVAKSSSGVNTSVRRSTCHENVCVEPSDNEPTRVKMNEFASGPAEKLMLFSVSCWMSRNG